MKQVTRRPKDGRISVIGVPAPAVGRASVLVANRFSMISVGTERQKVELGERDSSERRMVGFNRRYAGTIDRGPNATPVRPFVHGEIGR